MADVPGRWHNWHIAVACHIIFFLVFGMIRISGLIFAACITHFDVDREHASLPFVLGNIVKAFVCLGSGLATSIIPQVLNQYFAKHKTKANGFAIAGSSVAGFVLAPVVVALLKEYDVSGSFLILSALLLHSIPAAMLLKKPDFKTIHTHPVREIQVETQAESDGKLYCKNTQIATDKSIISKSKNENIGIQPQNSQVITKETETVKRENTKTFKDVIKRKCNLSKQKSAKKKDGCFETFSIFWNPIFLFIAVPRCVIMFIYNIVPMFLVDFFSDKGFSIEQSTYLLMVNSALDLIGKMCLGFITDSNYMSVTKFAALQFAILAASFVVMVFANDFVVMNLALAVFALCMGGITPLHPGLVADYFDTGKQTMAMASANLLLLPLSASAVSLIGYFRDDLGSYLGLLYVLAAAGVSSMALMLALPSFSSWWEHRKKSPSIQTDEMPS